MLCIASGPSLTAEDIESCRGKVDGAIAVNDSYRLCPWATALYAADECWWGWKKGAPDFHGLKYSLQKGAAKWPGVQVLRNTGDRGLETDPTGLRTGRNSGYQALNLAVHMGAKRVLLLGYQLALGPKGESHWHGDHPRKVHSPYQSFIEKFNELPPLLEKLGVEVVNCTPVTALTCFPRQSIREALR